MDTENLELTGNPEELIQPVSEAELVEPVSGEEKVVSEKPEGEEKPTLTVEEQIAQKLEVAEKEWQSRADKSLKTYQEKVADLESQLSQRSAQDFLAKVEAEGGDMDMAKRLVAKEQDLAKRESDFAQKKGEADQVAVEVNKRAKIMQASKLASQYGVDENELLKAQSPSEMETIASKLGYEKEKAKREELEKAPEKIDSSTTSATGEDWRGLSSNEKVTRGLSQSKKTK